MSWMVDEKKSQPGRQPAGTTREQPCAPTMVGMYMASSSSRLTPVKSSNSTAGTVFQSTACHTSFV